MEDKKTVSIQKKFDFFPEDEMFFNSFGNTKHNNSAFDMLLYNQNDNTFIEHNLNVDLDCSIKNEKISTPTTTSKIKLTDTEKISKKIQIVFSEGANNVTTTNNGGVVNKKQIPIKEYNGMQIPSLRLQQQHEDGLVLMNNNNDKQKSESELKKEKKLLMNRISAKKSRQKKKDYITHLENEIQRLKNEKNNLIISSTNNNNNCNGNNKRKTSVNKTKSSNSNSNSNSNKSNCSFINHKREHSFIEELDNSLYVELIHKENEIVNVPSNKKINNYTQLINQYTSIQKQLINKILIQQIQMLMPLKLKIFKDKFLKIEAFLPNDTLDDIIDKIDTNIETLKALYDFNLIGMNSNSNNNNNVNNINSNIMQDIRPQPIAYQLHSFYHNVREYIINFKSIMNMLEY
jgi:hypothetical protein